MTQIFLSASVPMSDRGDFHESADPFLIQFAVRELLTVCLGRRTVVWGGHPAITPMVWAVCEDLGVDYASAVKLYQSRFFEDFFPEENAHFANVRYVDAVEGNREQSIQRFREEMFSQEFAAGVFIGGMEGILDEFKLFRKSNPTAKVLALSAPGGAALTLARDLDQTNDGIDFARIFQRHLNIGPDEPRNQVGRLRLRP